MTQSDKLVPLWQKIAAIIYVVAAAVLFIVFRSRLGADFWPLDASRIAPNILATLIQIAAVTPVAVLLWPPTRRRIHRFIEKHTAPIHAKIDAVKKLHEQHHTDHLAALAETQKRLDHIIKHHPDIPPLK